MSTSLSNFLKRGLVFLLLIILIHVTAYADYETTGSLNGVYFKLSYHTYSDNVATIIAPPEGTKYVGDISINSNIRIGYDNFEVRGFESGAFIGQDEMVSLSCPITYGETPSPSEFEGCNKLENLKLFNANNYSTYTTYDGALYEKKQTFSKPYTTYYQLVICPPAISSLDVYNSTYEVVVNPGSFVSKNNLTLIKLSKTATVSGDWGEFINFDGFDASVSQNYFSSEGVLYTSDKKTLIAMPGKPRNEYKALTDATIIANSSFASCHIENLYLDDKSFTIFPFAFSNFLGNLHITGLSTLTQESHVTYIGGCKYFTNFNGNLYIKGEISQNFASYLGDLNENATIYCEGKYIDLIRKYWTGKIVSTTPCWISEREARYTSALFSLDSDIKSIIESAKVYFNGVQLNPNNGRFEINGLVPDSSYEIEIHYLDKEGNEAVTTDYIETLSIEGSYSISIISSTQTSVVCQLFVPKDILNLGLKGGIYSTNPGNISYSNENDDNEPIITVTELNEENVIYFNNYNQGIIKIEISGLTPDISHEFTPIIVNNNNQVNYDRWVQHYRTAPLNLSVTYSELTQRSFKISSIRNSGVFNCSDWVIKTKTDSGELIPIEGYGKDYLYPETEYYIPLYFEKNNVKFSSGIRVHTASINFNVNITDITPTTAKISASYNNGNAIEYIENIDFTISSSKYENNTVLTGLKPNTTYSVSMSVLMAFENQDGSKYRKTYSATKNFNTKELLLNTLPPNCVNSSTANVKAETNISFQETGAGFQWIKYDAPSSLSPNQGYGFVYEGVLEGQIKNLQPTSYYNVRAFYKSSDGTYYYGNWITFDPSDFSYFDPTVRSFDNPEIVQNNVTLYGYALGGSDAIISQGFQYWNNQTRSRNVDNVITVHANGQLMQATLRDLSVGNYSYRAYIETSNGFYYGDEYNFSIELSGIEDIQSDEDFENTVLGYYNLNGTRFDNPQNGFNIILYKDGTSKKIIIR